MTTQVAVVGATGRLGAQVCSVVESMEDWAVIARLDSQSDLQEVLGADVVVDVTQPGVSATVVDFAIEQGLPILVGTSGWSAERLKCLEKKVTDHPGASVFVVPNFYLGATVQNLLAATAAEFFDSVEIGETHHAGIVDSPSGTAVRAAETMARVRRDRGGVLAPHSEQSARW